MNEITQLLSQRAGWAEANTRLRHLWGAEGDRARQAAREYAAVYAGRRAAMVFDVVASRQRKYTGRVLPMVARFESDTGVRSLAEMANGGWFAPGLRAGEHETMRAVAAGLAAYGKQHGLDDDEQTVRRWAADTTPLEHAPALDPYVGSVRGIGPALFAYLRMRSGGDTLKPDVRVRRRLDALGFNAPREEHALLVLARAAAAELGVTLLELDQLLWLSEEPASTSS